MTATVAPVRKHLEMAHLRDDRRVRGSLPSGMLSSPIKEPRYFRFRKVGQLVVCKVWKGIVREKEADICDASLGGCLRWVVSLEIREQLFEVSARYRLPVPHST